MTELAPDEAVDILVVSALPQSYPPTRGSVIGALCEKGISVAYLARDKAADLREVCACWMSRDLEPAQAELGFRRILCFEPALFGDTAGGSR